jgi:hypothetical protein
MIQKKLRKLIGLKKEEFESFRTSGQIILQNAKLIPTLKTGDEMALTSIFLSTIKLVKEYRDSLFRELKINRGGKPYFYTEISFPELAKSRFDGLIIVVKRGEIVDAAFFEMKNKNNGINKEQIESYLDLSKKLAVSKIITVSNEFVADSSHSPVKVKLPKSVSLFHFSWTYLFTKGQLLVFDNDENIEDESQMEIMREALAYFENPISGVSGYTQMKPGWKELADHIRAQNQLKIADQYIEDAVLSWYEEEKDMALLLSRKLGTLVKSSPKGKDSLKSDVRRIVKENYISGHLSIKNSVSDIKIIAEFERRIVSMFIKVIPPLDKGSIARLTWIEKQLDKCRKKEENIFKKIEDEIWIEANIKFAQTNIKVKLSDLGTLLELTKGKEIQAFHIMYLRGFGASFASNKKFIELIEKMMLEYYAGFVQHMSNWSKPAPRLESSE